MIAQKSLSLSSTNMLCIRTAAARTNFTSISLPNRRTSAALKFAVKMTSSSSSQQQLIEHIVLFKVKPSVDPSAVAAMLTNLNSLTALDSVAHLAAGPVTRCQSKTLTFTHMLHSRYRSKNDLADYTDHPAHVSVVANYVKPVVEDVMAVDWVAEDFRGTAEIKAGSVARFTVLKLKEEGNGKGNEKEEVLEVLRGVIEKFDSIEQLTVGENFSPGRAKGYSIGSVAVFEGVKELEALDLEKEAAEREKEKVTEFVDGVLVLDFVVAPVAIQAAASL